VSEVVIYLPRHIRSKSFEARWIGRARNGGQSPAPKVVFAKNNPGFVIRDTFDRVTPFACQFIGRFATFNSCIHWEQLVIAKKFASIFFKIAQGVVVESPGGQCQNIGLRLQGLNDPGMTMALINSYIFGWKKLPIKKNLVRIFFFKQNWIFSKFNGPMFLLGTFGGRIDKLLSYKYLINLPE
jgi:hypothetical protein